MGEIRKATDLTWFAAGQSKAMEIFISPPSAQLTFQSCKWANDDVPSSVG